MAYTHADGRAIFATSRRFRALAAASVKAGDLLYMAGSTGVNLATHVTTGGAFTKSAWCVACEDIDATKTGWCALAVELRATPTVAAGGAWSEGTLATTADIMASLYLSGTAGQATSTAPTASSAVIKQYVGYILSTHRAVLAPTMAIIPAASA